MKFRRIFSAALIGALAATTITQATPEPRYAAKVPESVMTPDELHTELLGDLDFFDGMPVP